MILNRMIDLFLFWYANAFPCAIDTKSKQIIMY